MSDDHTTNRIISRRAFLLAGGQLGLLGVVGWRLYSLQMVEGDHYALLAEDNRVNLQLLAAERGEIFDRFGKVIARNVDNLQLTVIPSLAPDLARVLEGVASLIHLSKDEHYAILKRARSQAPYLPILVKDNLSWQQFAEINMLGPSLPGLKTEPATRRVYDQMPAMAHIIGYVGAGNKAEVKKDPALRLPGMRVGKAGIEKGKEPHLKGAPGVVKVEVNARGAMIRRLAENKSQKGSDLYLTIDHEIQLAAMQRIAGERCASIVAMDVNKGDLIALASTPTYDPGYIIGGLDDKAWANLRRSADDPFLNRAIQGQYPPGSTFKMVTALAALEAGVISPKTRINCSGGVTFGGHHFGCWKRSGHGAVALHKAIRSSCDSYFYTLARKVGIEKLAAMAVKLGFGQTYDFGLAGEKPGLIPTPTWKKRKRKQPWYGGETLIAGIGQGYVLSTPLQLAVMTARLASGRVIKPRLTLSEREFTALKTGKKTSIEPQLAPQLEIKAEWLQLVRRAMTGVVNERGGTGQSARLMNTSDKMAGKTGTSQVTSKSRHLKHHQLSWQERDHGLFVGFAPADEPRYAIAAVVEHGGSGSKSAAPIVRDLMQQVLEKDPANGIKSKSDKDRQQKKKNSPTGTPIARKAPKKRKILRRKPKRARKKTVRWTW